MIDLSELDTKAAANAGTSITLRHPFTNDDLDITINVLGRDSDAFNKIQSAQNKKRFERMQKNKKGTLLDDLDESGIALLAACTTGWTNVQLNGSILDFSEDNARMVYERFPWIREQIDSAIGDRANFTPPRSAASSNLPNTTSTLTQ